MNKKNLIRTVFGTMSTVDPVDKAKNVMHVPRYVRYRENSLLDDLWKWFVALNAKYGYIKYMASKNAVVLDP